MRWCFACVFFCSSCFPTLNVDGAFVSCASKEDCPAGLVCDDVVGLCVDEVPERDTTPPVVLDVNVAPADARGRGETATLTFTTSEPLPSPPVVSYLRGDGVPVVVTTVGGEDATSWTSSITPGDDDTSGTFPLEALLVDASDNETDAPLRVAVSFDVDPPELVDTKSTILTDPRTNPLDLTVGVRRGTSITTQLTFNEPIASATLEVGVDDIVLTGAISDNLAIFQPGDLLDDVPDNFYVSVLHAVDVRGNALDEEVPFLFIVDNTPPDPPEFTLLQRTPWATAADSGILTQFTATVSDPLVVAVLILTETFPVDGEAVPLHIARAFPDQNGLVTGAVPIDVPGLRLIAVDHVGNMSAPASASAREVTASVIDATSPHRVRGRARHDGGLLTRGDVDVTTALRAGETTTTATARWRPLTTVRKDAFSAAPLLAWDPVRNSLLAFAGGRTFHVEDGQVVADDVPPLPILRGGALAVDVPRGRVVLFGGADSVGTAAASTRNDLYEWDGERWLEILPNDPQATNRPRPRDGHGMAYVPSLGGVVVVNGCGNDDPQENFVLCPNPVGSDVWLWDGSTFAALCEGDACGASPPPFDPALIVDDEGRLVAFGGHDNFPSAVAIGAPVVPVFDGTRWNLECADACSEQVPVLPQFGLTRVPLATAGLNGEGAFVVDSKDGTLSRLTYARDTIQRFPLDGALPVTTELGRFRTLQQAGLALDPTGALWIGTNSLSNDGGQLWRIQGDRVDLIAPRTTTPRCGAALVVEEGAVATLGGCSLCTNEGRCAARDDTRQRIALDGGVRTLTTGPAGYIAAAPPLFVADDAAGTLQSFIDDAPASTIARTVRSPSALARDPAGGALLSYIDDSAGPAPELLRVGDDGAFSVACDVDCRVPGAQAAAAGGASFSVVFGGSFGIAVGADTLLVQDGAFVDLFVTGPPARRAAGMAFDGERDAAWLVGGSVEPEQTFGGASFTCGGGGRPPECDDLWLFDGATWTEVVPDAPFGKPPPRQLPAVAAVDDGIAVVGGNIGFTARDDAWRLDAPTDAAPAQLLDVSLAGMGSDADGTLRELRVHWCGEGADAAGDAVDVSVTIWTGAAFAPPVTSSGGCVDAVFTGDLSQAARGSERRVIALATPLVGPRAGVGAGFASLTTTAFELTAVFDASGE